jgi:hypothetical protein
MHDVYARRDISVSLIPKIMLSISQMRQGRMGNARVRLRHWRHQHCRSDALVQLRFLILRSVCCLLNIPKLLAPIQMSGIYHTGCSFASWPLLSSSSTGCLSKLSYHWRTLPIKKHHDPQKVAVSG